jgi:putative transposase
MPKHSYHPAIILAYYYNLLEPSILTQIPRSTLHDWDRRKDHYTFGADWIKCNDTLKPLLLQKQAQVAKRKLKCSLQLLAFNNLLQRNRLSLRYGEQKITDFVKNKVVLLKKQMSVYKILHHIGLSQKLYYKLSSSSCTQSHTHKCPLKHPQQILKVEVETVQDFYTHNQNMFMSMAAFFYHLKTLGKASYCLNTFYKLWHGLGLTVHRKAKKPENKIGIRTDEPLKLIHIDVTKQQLLDGSKAFIYVAKDNFSRAILAIKAYKELRAIHLEEVVQQLIAAYFTTTTIHTQIMTDGSPENKTLKGYIKRFALTNLTHIVAMVDVNYSNSMVEAANKTIKYNGLYLTQIGNFEALEKLLPPLKEKMNNNRMTVIEGLTPLEKLANKTVNDVYGNITYVYTKADRLKINRETNCCKMINQL